MKILILTILFFITACTTVDLPDNCYVYFNRVDHGFEIVTEIGRTCILPDGTSKTTIEQTFREFKQIEIPPIPKIVK